MSLAKKAAMCFVIAGGITAVFATLCFVSLFKQFEIHFYAPAVFRANTERLEREITVFNDEIDRFARCFSETLSNNVVRRSFLINRDAADEQRRVRIIAELQHTIPTLQWARFIDDAGERIRYSTVPDDYISQPAGAVLYRAWTDVPYSIRITGDMLSRQGVLLDARVGELLFFSPFYDSEDTRQGVALFAVSDAAIREGLLRAGLITVSEAVVVTPFGVLLGARPAIDATLVKMVRDLWEAGDNERLICQTLTDERAMHFMLFSRSTKYGPYLGFLADITLFAVPRALRVLFCFTFFLTVYIIAFFCANLKRDPVTIIRNRMRNLQVNLYREYWEHRADRDQVDWRRELAHRREAVREELRAGFNVRENSEVSRYIDSFFDRSWDELIAVMANSVHNDAERLDERRVQEILERILQATLTLVNNADGANRIDNATMSDAPTEYADATAVEVAPARYDDERPDAPPTAGLSQAIINEMERDAERENADANLAAEAAQHEETATEERNIAEAVEKHAVESRDEYIAVANRFLSADPYAAPPADAPNDITEYGVFFAQDG
jgi:hypothetical protein